MNKVLDKLADEIRSWSVEWSRAHTIDMSQPEDRSALFAAIRTHTHRLLLREAGHGDDKLDLTFPFIQCGLDEDGRIYLAWMNDVIRFDIE